MGNAKPKICAGCIRNIWGSQASQEEESMCLKEKIYQTEWCVQKNIHVSVPPGRLWWVEGGWQEMKYMG